MHAERVVCRFQGQGHSKGSYDQTMTVPTDLLVCALSPVNHRGLHQGFTTDDPLATKLGLVVHYLRPECLMEKLDCCIQGQSHSKNSKC